MDAARDPIKRTILVPTLLRQPQNSLTRGFMNEEAVRRLLGRECKKLGSIRAWAEEHGFSAMFVSDVINGRRAPGKRMLDILGLERERVVIYRRKK